MIYVYKKELYLLCIPVMFIQKQSPLYLNVLQSIEDINHIVIGKPFFNLLIVRIYIATLVAMNIHTMKLTQ